MKEKPTIIDGRRINHHEAEKLGFIHYGAGFNKPSAEETG